MMIIDQVAFADGSVIELGDDYQMPDGAWKAVSGIMDLCESCIEESGNSADVIPAKNNTAENSEK